MGVTGSGDFSWDNYTNNGTSKAYNLGIVKKVLHEAYITLYRPVIEFPYKVRDPHLFKHQTRLENVQRRAERFIAGFRGVESVAEG